jgi:fructose-1,6-bisphosphatase/inositol monophosphatase family enzyme
MQSLEELARLALEVATQAGQLVLEGWWHRSAFEKKRRTDLVTQFDLRSEQLIVDSLEARTPGLPVFC